MAITQLVLLDDERATTVDAVRPWAGTTDLPTAVDLEHRLSDLFGVVNVPATSGWTRRAAS